MTMILGKSIWSDKNSVEIINLYTKNKQDNLIF